MRTRWRRELDRSGPLYANNHLCPICECHVWTHAPGESYTVHNGENYHPACLKAEGIDVEAASPAQTGLTAANDNADSIGSSAVV